MTLDEANMTIDYLKEMQGGYIEGEGYERHPLPEWYALDKAIEAIEQTRWISVSDRLPEKGGDYLVTIKWKGSYSGDVYTETNMAVYREKEEEWDCAGIVAWMPLPEPYKAESEDKE